MAKFGEDCRGDFMLKEGFANINHGSYGKAPNVVLDRRQSLLQLAETDPDTFIRRMRKPMLDENTDAIAQFLGSDPENIVLVQNTTTGTNNVLKSLDFTSDDTIIINSWTYNAMKNACDSVKTRTGCNLVTIQMPSKGFQAKEEILQLYRTALDENKQVKLVIIDLVVSCNAMIMPLEEITRMCKERDILVLVDGAQAVFQLPINLEEMGSYGVDFFASSLHKWTFVPRGSGILWVHPKHHNIITPIITSHTYKEEKWRENFFQQGALDDTQLFVVKDALKYIEDKGGREAIVEYNNNLVKQAAQLLVSKWNTQLFEMPEDMRAPCMRLIKLPEFAQKSSGYQAKRHKEEVLKIAAKLNDEFGIDIQVFAQLGGCNYIRISAQIYNTIEDYQRLGENLAKCFDASGNLIIITSPGM